MLIAYSGRVGELVRGKSKRHLQWKRDQFFAFQDEEDCTCRARSVQRSCTYTDLKDFYINPPVRPSVSFPSLTTAHLFARFGRPTRSVAYAGHGSDMPAMLSPPFPVPQSRLASSRVTPSEIFCSTTTIHHQPTTTNTNTNSTAMDIALRKTHP